MNMFRIVVLCVCVCTDTYVTACVCVCPLMSSYQIQLSVSPLPPEHPLSVIHPYDGNSHTPTILEIMTGYQVVEAHTQSHFIHISAAAAINSLIKQKALTLNSDWMNWILPLVRWF